MKKIWLSKTAWIAAIAFAAAIAQVVTDRDVIDPEIQLSILAAVAFVLRLITKEPVGW